MGNKHKHRRVYCTGCITHQDDKIRIKKIKLGFYGDYQVGKSSIINSILGVEFNNDILTTIGYDKLETNYQIKKDISKKLILWDTPGQERFRTIALKSLKYVNGIVIVFDLTNKKSFENLDHWISDIYEYVDDKIPIVLLGNKADCDIERREVNEEEIKVYALRKKLKYFDVSAKTSEGINYALKYIMDEIINKYDII